MEANSKCPLFALSFLLITMALTSNTASILAEARHLLDATVPDDVPELPAVTVPTLPAELPQIPTIPLPQIPEELQIPNLAAIFQAFPSLPQFLNSLNRAIQSYTANSSTP